MKKLGINKIIPININRFMNILKGKHKTINISSSSNFIIVQLVEEIQ